MMVALAAFRPAVARGGLEGNYAWAVAGHHLRSAGGGLLHTERLRAVFTGVLLADGNDRIGQLRRDGVSGAALRDAPAELETRLAPEVE